MHGYFRQDFLKVPDGTQLYFQVQGENNPPLVLCDGLGCDGFIWKYLLPELRREHRILRWHYRGHGKSTVPADRERIGMVHTTEDLDRLMAHVGLGRAVIFGHSMGVQVALEFHRRFPERVAGLVLICGSYGNPLDTFHDDTLLRRVFPYLRRAVETFPILSRRLTRLALSSELVARVSVEVELNKELVRRADMLPYFDHLAKMDPVVFVRTLHALAEHSGWEHLPHINVPTLVIGGDRDTFTPMWLSRRMADTIPSSELLIVPGGSHTTPLEQPSLVNERVQRFLQERILSQVPRAPAADSPAQVA